MAPPPSVPSGTAAPAPGQALRDRLDGLLFFPVTAFGRDGGIDLPAYREHLRSRVDAGAVAVFAACGTGEFFSLDPDEYAAVVRAAVEEAARAANGPLPVVAGTGYGGALARRFARAAREAGADGLLAFPPYVADGGPEGLRAHYTALAADAGLPVILYQRDGVRFPPGLVADLAAVPDIVGFKDGRGDLELVRRIVGAVRDRHGDGALAYFNGMPTAELSAPAYRAAGVERYSSAAYAFAPDIAMAFHRAFRAGDETTAARLLDGFYRPLAELRDLGRGYAVSLVKAGVRLDGVDVGPVRPPLTEPPPAHLDRLAEIVTAGRALLAGPAPEGVAP
ncbi:5-dehydro-4-deoxyglucarate dehydratase [Actinomadura gamaensis]|uniref:Probable 5-dehydro-4-deoxyglucarate dehydratase n=1 Tax=Actinomadura gamaensis TaxID=1763541 RepID=A0ABV9TYX8_9ACTN